MSAAEDADALLDALLFQGLSGCDLPRPWFDFFLLGRLEQQRRIEDLEAEVRRLDALVASPGPYDTRAFQETFAEVSEIRGDLRLAEAALRRARINQQFGRGVA